MPLPRVSLKQAGWTGMTETLSGDVPEADRAFFLQNLFPVDPTKPSPLDVRRGFLRLPTTGGAAASGNGQWCGQFTKLSGTSYTVGVWGGQIYVYDASADTWTLTVTTANFATASITRTTTGRWYAEVYNDTLVVNDGTNQPWTWDGTSGAGGLTPLTNAPSSAYGKPTVYYGKVVFIKSDRATIVWSEENAANTGYEAGGYNNAWTLSQTFTSPLTAIVGTNLALYYFREESIGGITGAVTPDFQTSGVHDAVSSGIGTTAPDAVVLYDNRIWFPNQRGRPMVLTVGGGLTDLGGDMERRVYPNLPSTNDPYGSYEDVSAFTASLNATSIAYMATRYCSPLNAVVFFYRPDSVGVFGAVYATATQRLLGYLTVQTETITAVGQVLLDTGASGSVTDTLMVLDGSGNASILRGGAYKTTGNYFRDDIAGTAAGVVARLIGGKHVHDEAVGLHYDRFTLEARASGTGVSFGIQMLTSERWRSADLSSAQTVTTDAGGADVAQPRRYTVGLAQYGRWVAPVIAVNVASSNAARLHRYQVDAFVDAADAALV